MALLSKLADSPVRVSVSVMAENEAQAAAKAKALAQLSNLSLKTLHLLADKSKKPGIEKKLETYKHLI